MPLGGWLAVPRLGPIVIMLYETIYEDREKNREYRRVGFVNVSGMC